MDYPEDSDAPEHPKSKGNIKLPLLFNTAMLLLIYPVASIDSTGTTGNIALGCAILLGALIVFNIVAALVASLLGKSETAKGFLYSILGINLIGLGTCAYIMVLPT
jgi:putative exporter of polyketide antibiotics